MKKSLIALAVLAASGAAMAQSSVTLFGIVDTGVSYVDNASGDNSRYGVHSDYDGDFAVASFEAGYRFDGVGGSLVPYVGAEHAQVRSDGFHEQGAAGFGLRTGANTSSRTQAIAGLRASREWRRFSVSGYAEWQQTLSSDGLALSASFVGVDSWSPLAGSNPALSGGMVGLQATAWLGTHSTLSFGYDQRFGPRGDASLVSLKYAFGF